jgi:DNA invertase Pin-like site-specific DNA recombinase
MGTRAVGYIRVSSATQLDGYGLAAQEADIRKSVKSYGLRLTQVFRDEGVSGSLEAALRPGLAEALARIESGDAEVLLIPRLDRLARRLTIQEAALAQVWRHGGTVVAADQGEIVRDDPDDPMRTAMRQMMGVFAQLERSMIVARLRRGREMKRASGGYAAGRPRYGYRADGGFLVAVPEEQRTIKLARRLKKQGLSYRQIADRLEAEGLQPRSGGRWHPPMVSRLVNSEAMSRGA